MNWGDEHGDNKVQRVKKSSQPSNTEGVGSQPMSKTRAASILRRLNAAYRSFGRLYAAYIWMVNSMNSNKRHKKVGLAGNGDCRVVLCPDCGTLEINFGSSTIRTNYESLQALSSVLNHAKVRLAQMKNESSAHDNPQQIRSGRVH
jgi:hypothetical protein